MSGSLLKALIVLAPVVLVSAWSVVTVVRRKTVWGLVQLAGAGCLVVVVLTHVCEALGLFPAMQWGSPASVGHYFDLSSAILGLVLLPAGYLGARSTHRRADLA